MLLMNSKNCVAWTIEYGIADCLDQLLLRDLGAEVAALGEPLGADHRQRDVVLHTGRAGGREQIAGRRGEELHDGRVLERRRVRDVDDDRRRPEAPRPVPRR